MCFWNTRKQYDYLFYWFKYILAYGWYLYHNMKANMINNFLILRFSQEIFNQSWVVYKPKDASTIVMLSASTK